jgi:hypothetical protein
MTKRTAIVIASVVLILAAFLAGFWPQYQRAGQFESELATQRERVRILEANQRLAAAAHLASAMFLESSKLNYGVASEMAGEFFSRVRTLIGEATDPTVRHELEEIAAKRDSVVAALAKGDAAVQTDMRDILQRMLAIARRQP